MTDREQMRRDDVLLIDSTDGFRVHGANFQRMAGINDLTRALREARVAVEQAERERDAALAKLSKWVEPE